MKQQHPPRRRGFTLLELTVTIAFGLAIASAGMMMLTQQITVIRILNEQTFLLEDAPRINQSLSSLLGRADAVRVHTSFADALADRNAVTQDGTVLVAAFRDIDETTVFGIITFESDEELGRLSYYIFDPAGATPVLGTPSWSISRRVSDANFSLVDGLFQIALAGPDNEQLTYTISPNQS